MNLPSLSSPSPPSGRDWRPILTALIVGLTTVWLIWTMSPWAWFIDSTPTGGDMGAHVWSPKFLREELLPNFRLTGWSPDWYAGFPAFTFYMIIPSLAIVIVNVGIEFSFGPLDIDLDFWAFVGALLATYEIGRRLRVSSTARMVSLVGVAASSIALSWRYDGRTLDPKNILRFWSPVEPFTYNDTSLDLAVAAIVLPAAVGSYVFYRAAQTGRWRGVITAAAVITTILIVPIPYGVAMKLIVISGIITLPLAAYAAGRLGGLVFPGPALLAVMTLPFLFDRSFNIYGGNIMSTMAGEFAYSMGLSIAVLFIGVAVRGTETGRHRGIAAALLALAGLTHLFAAFFAIVVSVAIFLVRMGKKEFGWFLVMGPLAGLLAAFWVLPFYWNTPYLNDMGWGKERDYVGALWDRGGDFGGHTFLTNALPLQIFVVLAIVSAVICAVRRVRFGIVLAFTAILFAIAFFLLPESRLWNVRILPFYYLSLYLLSGVGIAEGSRVAADFLRAPDAIRERRPTAAAGFPALLTMVVVILALGLPLRSVPFGTLYTQDGAHEYGLDFLERGTRELNLGPGWMRYNFRGYEAAPGNEEYRHLVVTMDRVGEEFGCGQSLWEYEGDRLGSYGTPMAPMLLPHWTDGCIGSMEGLYFEASATTPYHFLLQSELSTGPSRAMRDMPYSGLNVEKGVEGLQTMGVRYYMASTEQAIAQARDTAALEEIATSGPWAIFLVEGQSVAEGLSQMPVVVDGVDAGGEEWLIPTVAWWESGHNTPLVAADGPADWPRSSIEDLVETDPALQAAATTEDRVLEMRLLAERTDEWLPSEAIDVAEITNIDTDTASISFDVDQIGTPVLVRASYFPNWNVSGADGPYRVAPNLMVVVPTDTHVELTYGRSNVEILSMGLTFLGFAALFGLRRIPRARSDERVWDLAGDRLALPPIDEIYDDVRSGVMDRVALEDIERDAGDHLTWAIVTAWISLALMFASCVVSWLATRSYEWLVPGGDKPKASFLVFAPGAIGAILFVFVAVPGIAAAYRYRRAALRGAFLLADVVGENDDDDDDDPFGQ
jgi:hypothetical protein